tara:strand:+ start:127 stop:1590 length:1464 start_codon:yes stop_codon:yes gene_type:complete
MDNANLQDLRKRYLQLHPVNATSGGVFSFKNGLPLIKFDISSSQMPLFLDGSSLRISGRFTAFQGAAGNTQLTNTELNFLDGFCGVNQVIESVNVYSKRLNENLERVNSYYRLCPSIVSGRNAFKDIETTQSNHGGQHATCGLTRPGLNCYNAFDKVGAVTAANQRGIDFSIPLYAGIFNSGQDIDLSSVTGTGGLVIEILLRSDVGGIFGANAAANTASYQLSNLLLTAPVYEMSGGAAQSYAGQVNQFNFNTWSSMFQTLNASDSVLAMTPGLSRVSSILMSFITAGDLGNQNFNSSRLGPVGEVRQLRWSKNGALFPLQYRLQTVEQQNNDLAKINVGNNGSYHTYDLRSDIFRNYLEGLTTDRYNKVRNCSAAYNNFYGGSTDRSQNSGRDGITPQTVDGMAMLYDAYGGGVNFQQMVWSIQLQTSATNQLQITDGDPGTIAGAALNLSNSIDGTAATAQAVSIFYLNKNTLLLSPNGINVVR